MVNNESEATYITNPTINNSRLLVLCSDLHAIIGLAIAAAPLNENPSNPAIK